MTVSLERYAHALLTWINSKVKLLKIFIDVCVCVLKIIGKKSNHNMLLDTNIPNKVTEYYVMYPQKVK